MSANTSLDKTSQPGKPGSEGLIRSGYALRVGEIDALVVSDGTMSIVGYRPTGPTEISQSGARWPIWP